jgi:hypothetical protein
MEADTESKQTQGRASTPPPAPGGTGVQTTAPGPVAEKDAKCYVVSDAEGFVGAFLSPTEAVHRMQKYSKHGIPFLITECPLKAGVSTANVYAIPYRGNNAVAFVSNDVEEAKWAQNALARVGLVFEDDVTFWECPTDHVLEVAERRLEQQIKPHKDSETSEALSRFMEAASLGANTLPLDEPEKIDILRGVVPRELPGPTPAEPAAAEPGATAIEDGSDSD